MRFAYLIGRLDFQNESLFDQNINPERRIEGLPIENQRDRELPDNLKTACFKPSSKDGFIDILKQARAEFPVNGHCFINNGSGDAINIHENIPSASPLPLRLCEKPLTSLRNPPARPFPQPSTATRGRSAWP
jgi:hypothetical protein